MPIIILVRIEKQHNVASVYVLGYKTNPNNELLAALEHIGQSPTLEIDGNNHKQFPGYQLSMPAWVFILYLRLASTSYCYNLVCSDEESSLLPPSHKKRVMHEKSYWRILTTIGFPNLCNVLKYIFVSHSILESNWNVVFEFQPASWYANKMEMLCWANCVLFNFNSVCKICVTWKPLPMSFQ